MLDVKHIILEELEGILTEIGDASAKVYPYTKQSGSNYLWYKFTTEDNDIYSVTIRKNDAIGDVLNVWIAEFSTISEKNPKGGDFNQVVNKGRMYKVMSTLTQILKEFAEENHPDVMVFIPADKEGSPTQRFNLYLQFINKNLPPNYEANDVLRENLIFIINKDIFNRPKEELLKLQKAVSKSLWRADTDSVWRQIEYLNDMLKGHIIQTYGGRLK